MEGISGVVHPDMTSMQDKEFDRARKLMTGEANAAILGAFDGGANEVVVNDSHWTMRNILIEDLDPRAQLISGSPKPLSMMQGIDASFDAAMLVGYHSKAGTASSTMDHTYTGFVMDVSVNGQSLGEAGLNAALAGYYKVPVVMVSGDKALSLEIKATLGQDVETVIVKESYSRSAARCLAPSEAQRVIREGAKRAVQKVRAARPKPFVIQPPLTLAIEFAKTAHADYAELIPGARRPTGRCVEFTHDDYAVLYKAYRAMVGLAGLAEPK